MKKKKRIGIIQAKKIFHRRPLRSQAIDRKRTSKNLVYPLSGDSWKWAKDPAKYDMVFVDTKSLVPKTVHEGQVFVEYEKAGNLREAQMQKRELLAGFSTRLNIPAKMSTKRLEQLSNVNVHYIKTSKGGYKLLLKPKKKKFAFMHPVFMHKD